MPERIIHEIWPSELKNMGASLRAWRYAASDELPCHMMLMESGLIKLDVREGVFIYDTKEAFLDALDRLGEEMEAYEREHGVDLGHKRGSDAVMEEMYYGDPPDG